MAFLNFTDLSIFDKKSIVVDKFNQNKLILIVENGTNQSSNECSYYGMEIGAGFPAFRC